MSAIEALYMFDEHNNPILEHTYTGRPAQASTVLPLYLAQPAPRPSLIYLPTCNPPTLLYSTIQDQLLFLAPCSFDGEPLQVLEFLHRVGDVLEDFLGAPLLASKIEANYDTVAQLLSEMVDGGVIACTEPNALRDVVEAPNFIKTLLGGVGLPSTTPSSLAPSSTPFSLSSRSSMSGRASPNSSLAQTASPVPWRRANVRHTSNELYVDVVETLQVTIAPSGRTLSAIANGTIAFTAKVSGVPDLFLQIACPGGIANAVALPVFHPCVRLNRWRERPGDLSFVPPDGRFVLAGYEVDLLGPAALDAFSTSSKRGSGPKLNIPATTSILTSLGPTGADFEVRLTLNPRYAGKPASPSPNSSSAASSSFNRASGLGRGLAGASFGPSSGTTAAPTIGGVVVRIPLPASVKNVADLRVSRAAGEASYAPGERAIEWRLSTKEVGLLMERDRGTGSGAVATLSGTVVGRNESDGLDDAAAPFSARHSGNAQYDYDGEGDGLGHGDAESPSSLSSSYQAAPSLLDAPPPPSHRKTAERDAASAAAAAAAAARSVKMNRVLMPSCATVSFDVKGWLASGIRVESLSVDTRKSTGLGAGVMPYKGVKYVCVSREGVECRA